MDWPSDRVAQGGIFQPAKVNYSPETKKFLQELMAESKLSMMQRKKINYSLRSGDPLPLLSSNNSEVRPKQKLPQIIIRTGTMNKRRQYSDIVESGAYEKSKYVPLQKGIDREHAKRHLQDFMAFGKEIKDVPKQVKKDPNDLPEANRFDDIKREIQERVEWLEEMDKLGEGHKYKILIEQQIASRIREMKRLQPSHSKIDH